MLYCLAQNRMQQFKGGNKGKNSPHFDTQFYTAYIFGPQSSLEN